MVFFYLTKSVSQFYIYCAPIFYICIYIYINNIINILLYYIYHIHIINSIYINIYLYIFI